MNCADARHALLTADISALDARAGQLREHLNGCESCGAAAGVIVDDTTRLRAALQARRARAIPTFRRGRRVALTLIPLALAAELAFLSFSSPDAVGRGVERLRHDSLMSVTPVVTQDTEPVIVPTRQPTVLSTVAMWAGADSASKSDSMAARPAAYARRSGGVVSERSLSDPGLGPDVLAVARSRR